MKFGKFKVKKAKRTVKRKPRIARPLTQGKLYKFKRTCQALPYYFDGANWVQYGFNIVSNSNSIPFSSGIFKFRLTDLPNPTDFTQLYEQFKITGVKLRFVPYIGTETAPGGGYLETMAMAIDRGANDQVVVSPSFDSLLENQDVKLRNTQRGFSLWIGTPTFHQPADGLAQGAYKSGWLDSDIASSRGVDYHGVKWSFQVQRPVENAVSLRVFATYYITCRNPQ